MRALAVNAPAEYLEILNGSLGYLPPPIAVSPYPIPPQQPFPNPVIPGDYFIWPGLPGSVLPVLPPIARPGTPGTIIRPESKPITGIPGSGNSGGCRCPASAAAGMLDRITLPVFLAGMRNMLLREGVARCERQRSSGNPPSGCCVVLLCSRCWENGQSTHSLLQAYLDRRTCFEIQREAERAAQHGGDSLKPACPNRNEVVAPPAYFPIGQPW